MVTTPSPPYWIDRTEDQEILKKLVLCLQYQILGIQLYIVMTAMIMRSKIKIKVHL